MSSVLVPIDGSDTSLRALQHAIDYTQKTGDSIVILNVQPSIHTSNVRRFFSERDVRHYQEELSREALFEATRLLDRLGITYEEKLRIGSAAKEISNEATALGASLIIMGSRGTGAIAGKLLGSVSYGVLHEASCPVTIVR